MRIERGRFPAVRTIADGSGDRTRIETVELPAECSDGFIPAFWNRPEALLDPAMRASQSTWSPLPPGAEQRIVERLSAAALDSGAWDAEHGHLRGFESYDASVRLVISELQLGEGGGREANLGGP